MQQAHTQNAALHLRVVQRVLAVHLYHRVAVGVSDGDERLVQRASECVDVPVDAVDAKLLDGVEAVAQACDAQEVDGAVLVARARTILRLTLPHRTHVEHGDVRELAGDLHGASAPVQLAQHVQVLVTDQESADSRGIPEYLVEGHGDEIGLVLGEVQGVGGDEGGRVQQDEPFVAL